jgi:ABC-2 type transport system permease protein
MLESLTHVYALLVKELNEIRRQPRLLASLILGPFLILMLFGVGFQGGRPELQTVIVLPSTDMRPELAEQAQSAFEANADIVGETTDRSAALALLAENQIDVVKVLPPEGMTHLESGEQAVIQVYSNSIDPQTEDWIEYVSFGETKELNQGILQEIVKRTQSQAYVAQRELRRLHQSLDAIDRELTAAQRSELAEQIDVAREALALAVAIAPLVNEQMANESARNDFEEESTVLSELERLLATGAINEQQQELRAIVNRIERLEDTLQTYISIPAEVIVEPLRFEHRNLHGSSYSLETYFLPAVLALLVQHIGVALGALAIVRERLIGAFEMFRVAPISISEIIIGKYAAYLLMTLLVVSTLGLLLTILNMPIGNQPASLAVLVILLTLAALGVGFLISTVSTTESQAVQLTLLVLLLSIFFGNFFLPLENFWQPVQVVGYVLPLTHGIHGLHNIMLRNQPVAQETLLALGIIAGFTFVLTLLLMRLQTRQQ